MPVSQISTSAYQNSTKAGRFFVLPLFVIAVLVQADHLVMMPLSAEIANATGLSLTRTGLLVTIFLLLPPYRHFSLPLFQIEFGEKNAVIFDRRILPVFFRLLVILQLFSVIIAGS